MKNTVIYIVLLVAMVSAAFFGGRFIGEKRGERQNAELAAERKAKKDNEDNGESRNAEHNDNKNELYIIYAPKGDTPDKDKMDAAVSMIRERLESNCWTEATARERNGTVYVEIPRVDDLQATAENIGSTAHLTFCDEEGDVLVDGKNISDAQPASTGVGSYIVSLTFDPEGTKAFADATAANIGKPLVIMMDDIAISAPTVNDAITDGKAQISGDFTLEQVRSLAGNIKSGSLPFELEVVEVGEIKNINKFK